MNVKEESVFAEALETADPRERAAFLDRACAGNAALRASVESLLVAYDAGSFLESPAVQHAAGERAGQVSSNPTQGEPPSGADDSDSLHFLTPSEKPDSLGRLGHYEIQEVIGHGGMGIVLRAFDDKLHRVVAIKVMAAQLATNAMARRRFIREAQAAAAVSHDHIVTIHAVEEANGLPYLVMQYVSGLSLQQRLDRDGPLQVTEIVRIGMQTASGLAAAHAQGLIHRDIKPANILLENGVERVKITDFGLARAATDASLTMSGVVAGTPQYMSPEQAQGARVDQRSDLFSLGSVLYAMCTGRLPFRASENMAVLKRVCEEPPAPIRNSNAEVPEWLVTIIDKLHAKNPAERFQSATEVAALLGRHLAHLQHPSVAPLPSGVARPESSKGVGENTQGGGQSTPFEDSGRATQRRRWPVAAALLLAFIGGLSLTEATGVTNLRATVIRILTPDGTLVVETNDPGVKVTIEGDGGLVITGAGLEEIRLRPGSYKIHADRDGKKVPLERELVSIAKGGREVVRVKLEGGPIQAATKAESGVFKDLFNGKDLTGWTTKNGGTGNWIVVDGAITCSGKQDHLYTERDDFSDFHLRAEVKINAAGNSGIYFRTGKPLLVLGDYEAQITNHPGQKNKTGSLFGVNVVQEMLVPPDTWFTYEIIAHGQRLRLLVNGKQTADYTEGDSDRRSKGHIALQHLNNETQVQFRKIEIKELEGAPTHAATKAERGAFVVLGGKGVPERKLDTLAEAVKAAFSGDTIEIRGDGPFVSQPLRLSQKALVLRAGPGSRPVFMPSPEALQAGYLLRTSAPLVLEGLEFHYAVAGQVASGVHSPISMDNSSALFVTHCRIIGRGSTRGIGCLSQHCEVRHCEFLLGQAETNAVSWKPLPASRLIMDNCTIAGNALSLPLGHKEDPVPGGSIAFTRNSMTRGSAIVLGRWRLDESGDRPLSLMVTDNVVAGRGFLFLVDWKPVPEQTPAAAEAFLKRLLSYQDQRNLVDAGTQLLVYQTEGGNRVTLDRSVKDLQTWQAFWPLERMDSIMGPVRFQGGKLADRVVQDPHGLTPADFRLADGSPGKGAGPGGKDLGADVDLVGPGPAYERWKNTLEYQQWLKDTKQTQGESRERQSAEVFLRHGGKIHLWTPGGSTPFRLDKPGQSWPTGTWNVASVLVDNSTTITNGDLAALRDFPRLNEVNLAYCRVTTAALLDHIEDKPLRELYLNGVPTTRADAVRLGKIKTLVTLYVTGANWDDDDMAQLAGLPLRAVNVGRTKITDRSLELLGRLPNLTHLYVTGTKISDAGLTALYPCKTLRRLDVSRTRITVAGIEKLRQALPQCEVTSLDLVK